ncbi:hypothetical protein H310_12147 [Aphanomyces invadans]|uniref:Uncharacterized protein n=1 Tax=Aphanomyces invadans TaxID=157072 RepID=A0A024TLA7_9STRA|nr:hypothetical protein H310_12147 [Aphanomyces invadans]ETV94147.1 hypothetical protein H310_12147 [Aphanomyces invadans]|eukprot:XP_008877350.1 hypothetical protein H310_12147 [Aphanomyces invadans]
MPRSHRHRDHDIDELSGWSNAPDGDHQAGYDEMDQLERFTLDWSKPKARDASGGRRRMREKKRPHRRKLSFDDGISTPPSGVQRIVVVVQTSKQRHSAPDPPTPTITFTSPSKDVANTSPRRQTVEDRWRLTSPRRMKALPTNPLQTTNVPLPLLRKAVDDALRPAEIPKVSPRDLVSPVGASTKSKPARSHLLRVWPLVV